MALDIEPNDTSDKAVVASLLGPGGYFNAVLMGAVNDLAPMNATSTSASDPVDWWRIPVTGEVLSVRLQSYGFWYSSDLLGKPGVNGESRHLEIAASGGFSGPTLIVEARYGMAAYGADYGALSITIGNLFTTIFNDYLAKMANGIFDAALSADMDRLIAIQQSANLVTETDGLNANYDQIASDIRHTISSGPGGSSYFGQVSDLADQMADLIQHWTNAQYFRDGAPIPSLLSLELPTYLTSGDGLLQVKGYSIGFDTSGVAKADPLDYNLSLFISTIVGTNPGKVETGGPEDNILNGGDLDDILSGGPGFDTVIGGPGDDFADGGSNPANQGDFLLGGDGDDIYYVDSPLDFADEGIVFPQFGFGGFDTIISTADFYWDLYSVGERIIIADNAVDIGNDGTTIVAGVFDNEIIGNDGINVLFGRGGSDVYRPGGGIDFMSFSTLGVTDAPGYTANGVNTLVMERGNSYDIVFEFEVGRDKVDLTDFDLASSADLFSRGRDDGIGNSYFILGDGYDYLYLVGLELSELQAGDFIL